MLGPEKVGQNACRALSLTQISEKTEDKAMYDAREKAIRDYQTAINSALREGREEGKEIGQQIGELRGNLMGTMRTLQEILVVAQTDMESLRLMSTEELEALAAQLQQSIRSRSSPAE